MLDKLEIRDCVFQNSKRDSSSLIFYQMNQDNSELIVDNCHFENITLTEGGATIDIHTIGDKELISINKCVFTNCIGELKSVAGSIYINQKNKYNDKCIITNNKFINCSGQQAGGIYIITYIVNINISNNIFIGNSINGTYGSEDAFLEWYYFPEGWSRANIKSKVEPIFQGCISTVDNSVFYLVDYFATNPTSGYIQLQQYCKSQIELTRDCICNPDSQSYPIDQCSQDKSCSYDLIHQNQSYCPCLNSGDPRAGKGECPAYCIKGQVTPDCVCDTGSSSYPESTCEIDKLCVIDLAHQSTNDCPCLSTGDPRAGNTCPAYCTGPDIPTQDCVCDSNPSAQYPPQTCQSDQKCNKSSSSTVPKDSCTCTGTNYPSGCKCPTDSSQLNGIPSSRCECRTSGDPRAGNDICPAYCIKESITPDCVCETNSSSYTTSTCQTDKLCLTDLVHQNIIDCPCQSTADPRNGSFCPVYCMKGYVSINCVCDTNSTIFPLAQCQKDMLCATDLVHQSASDCPCLPTGDPRAGNTCPAYCTAKDQPNEECVCDSNPNAKYSPQTCQSDKKCTASSSSTVPKDSCTCSGTNYPSGCKCPTDQSQLTGIPKEICECRTTGDPRANGICPAYCTGPNIPTSSCVCDSGSTNYPFTTCQSEKNCTVSSSSTIAKDSCKCTTSNYPTGCKCSSVPQELVGIPKERCECLPTGELRAGGICPLYCTSKDQPSSNCACDINSSSYPPSLCQSEKQCNVSSSSSVPTDSCTCTGSNYPSGCKCPTDSQQLNDIPIEKCECRSTSDPRAGKGQCPAYCTGPDIPTSDCVCDSNPSAQYPPQLCQSDKNCTTQSGSSVPQDSCSCTIKNYPSGCKCPTNSSQLIGIPLQICDCRTSGDPRAGGACPAYCVKGYTNAYCVCDTNSSSYPSEYCEKDKLCITDLIHQTKADCPCLMKGDPRAGDVCPSYCISKSELTIECMCELGSSSYPQAQCERDKLCIVDLIHQSTSNCPCLAVDDPRGESVCKQTEINPSDPDPTDPIIPDPSEKDPETDQEQEQESEPKQDDEDEQKKEESSSTILISIIIPVIKKQEQINQEREREKGY
ncbi:MAG: hypothetical protein EZS28_018524 [Streblomastix strix]|uniref:Right handed beta helix domain-containing protein n=1 Tax=Streblomastix strix TaxID=222440 RepID=A0A5J4VTL3_9EUKA|nr:MAG: hypothetical protein EZS28_018524 [Streblomastix strix]